MNHRLFARSAMLTSLMLALVFGAAALFAVQNLFGGSLALLLSGGNYELMLPSSLVFSVVVAVVTFLFFFQLLCNRFSRVFLLCATVAYLLGIAWVVFFKSIGIRGVNLDPIDFFLSASGKSWRAAGQPYAVCPTGGDAPDALRTDGGCAAWRGCPVKQY